MDLENVRVHFSPGVAPGREVVEVRVVNQQAGLYEGGVAGAVRDVTLERNGGPSGIKGPVAMPYLAITRLRSTPRLHAELIVSQAKSQVPAEADIDERKR